MELTGKNWFGFVHNSLAKKNKSISISIKRNEESWLYFFIRTSRIPTTKNYAYVAKKALDTKLCRMQEYCDRRIVIEIAALAARQNRQCKPGRGPSYTVIVEP